MDTTTILLAVCMLYIALTLPGGLTQQQRATSPTKSSISGGSAETTTQTRSKSSDTESKTTSRFDEPEATETPKTGLPRQDSSNVRTTKIPTTITDDSPTRSPPRTTSADDDDTVVARKTTAAPSSADAVSLSVTRTVDETGVIKFSFYENEIPCLKAKFKLSFLITYESVFKNSTSQQLQARLEPPSDVLVSGACARANNTHPRILLEWGGGNYLLNIQYGTSMAPRKSSFDSGGSDEELEMVGQATSITFTYNMNDSNVFLHPVHGGIYTAASSESETFFDSTLNSSYRCSSPAEIPLLVSPSKGRNQTVMMTMSDARIQTYNLRFHDKFSEEQVCEADRVSPSKNIIPIAVAGCLAGVIVLVVFGYFIFKRTGRFGYHTMRE